MSDQPVEAPVKTIAGFPDVREEAVPYQGSNYVCPSCEQPIPTRKQIRLAKPAKYEGALNDVLKCAYCNFIFSPKTSAQVLRE